MSDFHLRITDTHVQILCDGEREYKDVIALSEIPPGQHSVTIAIPMKRYDVFPDDWPDHRPSKDDRRLVTIDLPMRRPNPSARGSSPPPPPDSG